MSSFQSRKKWVFRLLCCFPILELALYKSNQGFLGPPEETFCLIICYFCLLSHQERLFFPVLFLFLGAVFSSACNGLFLLNAFGLTFLFLTKVLLKPTLTLSQITISCFKLKTLFLLLSAKDTTTSLTSHYVVLRPPFFSRLGQFVQTILLKPAPYCSLCFSLMSAAPKSLPLFSFPPFIKLLLCSC